MTNKAPPFGKFEKRDIAKLLWGSTCWRQAGWISLGVGIVGLCMIATGCTTSRPVTQNERQAVIDRILAVSAKIIIEHEGHGISSGSGTVVMSRIEQPGDQAVSYVLTAAHILDGKRDAEVFVRFAEAPPGKKKFAATVIRRGNGETLDLALLRVPDIAMPAAFLPADDRVRIGEEILVVGYPWGKRLGMFSGIVSQVPGDGMEETPTDEGTEQTIVVDAISAKGVSGGGVFREATGSLVGIVEGYQTASISVKDRSQTYSLKVPMPGETFVIPVTQIRHFLDEAGLLGASEVGEKVEGRRE